MAKPTLSADERMLILAAAIRCAEDVIPEDMQESIQLASDKIEYYFKYTSEGATGTIEEQHEAVQKWPDYPETYDADANTPPPPPIRVKEVLAPLPKHPPHFLAHNNGVKTVA